MTPIKILNFVFLLACSNASVVNGSTVIGPRTADDGRNEEPTRLRKRNRKLKNNKKGGGDWATSGGSPRSYSTPGVPVMTGTCSGTDKVLSDYGSYQLTESKCGYLERAQCINPYTVSVAKKNDPRTDERCLMGTCGGCCRDFNFLSCDETGKLNSYVPCVCSERTYGGNPFSPPTGPAIPVPAPTAAVVPPIPAVPAAAPIVDDRGITGSSASVNVGVGYPGCNANWLGKNLGEKPATTPPNFPPGLSLGECTSSSHCADTTGQCCMNSFCLCGTPSSGRSNCRA